MAHAHAERPHGHDIYDHRHDYFDAGHPDEQGAEEQQGRVAYRLLGTLLGGALVLNAYLCDWLLPGHQVDEIMTNPDEVWRKPDKS